MDVKDEVISEKAQSSKTYTLMGADKKLYVSQTPGTYGGNRKTKVYGTMDCPAALRALAKYGYIKDRVFFTDEQTAIAAGFRPCAACQREKYKIWKNENNL
ncbi:Ada metal-binding domain-containing protein [Neobacillus sp. SAB-20_R2A]|uniref:Ada metal-binding domain-containing protein n=1 Tax=Neobacillus sp. SAB-20_R2A TaxID=3120519 RepID=UPI003C6E8189